MVKVFDFRPTFVNRFLVKLGSTDWSVIDNTDCIDRKCSLFTNQITYCMKEFPVYYVPITDKDKPWITPLIKHLIQQRWEAYRSKRFPRYNELKRLIQIKIIKAKKDWASKFNNPGDLWKKVNHINSRKNNNSLENLLNSFHCTNDLCDVINSVFCKNYSTSVKTTLNDIVSDCNNFVDSEWDLTISENDVFEQLSLLDSKKAFGSDFVPTYIYKICSHIIAHPLACIFNSCIKMSYFPSAWKEAHVAPIPKCHNATVHDLRPISLLCIPSKIFEKLIFNSVKNMFYTNFDSAQFGFRQNSSTVCALIKLHDHITTCFDSAAVAGVQVFALDYSKAFDRLDHNVIIRKLVNCNFPLSFIKLMYSYLSNRSQRVRINNFISYSVSVTSGVPQGSILGPSLFSIVMADLHRVNSSTCMVKFADDVTLSVPIFYSTNNVIEEINNVKNWSHSVHLSLNYAKCKYFLVSSTEHCDPVHVTDFQYCSSLKILGVHFSKDLKWDIHFSNIFVTANRRAFAFRVLKSNLSTNELYTVYQSLIVSIFDYCAPLFIGLNQKNCNIIKQIQRKFHNIVCFYNCHCNRFPDISIRRVNSSVKLFIKAYEDPDHLLNCIIPVKRSFFCQPYCKTDTRKRSFIPFVTEIVNSKISRT